MGQWNGRNELRGSYPVSSWVTSEHVPQSGTCLFFATCSLFIIPPTGYPHPTLKRASRRYSTNTTRNMASSPKWRKRLAGGSEYASEISPNHARRQENQVTPSRKTVACFSHHQLQRIARCKPHSNHRPPLPRSPLVRLPLRPLVRQRLPLLTSSIANRASIVECAGEQNPTSRCTGITPSRGHGK